MTTNHHTAIATGAAANAANFNSPLSQLDSALTSGLAGGTAFTGFKLNTETTLTIASGAIARTLIRHQVDTESAAATDDLTDITGGSVGQVLHIRSVSASRVVTVKHNAAKIYLSSLQDYALDNPLTVLVLICIDGTIWAQWDALFPLSISANNSFKYPRDLAVLPDYRARNGWGLRSAAATTQPIGIVSTSANGTPTASNDTDSTYTNWASGAVIGNAAGVVAATFNHVRRQHNPRFTVLVRTVAAGDIANIRWHIGLCSAAPSNVDTLVGVCSYAGFRFNTVAGDAGWTPVTCDNATQNVGSMVSGGTIAAATRYLLVMEINDADGTVDFSVNNGPVSTLSANLPAATTELGYSVTIFTTAAAAKNFKFSRMWCEFD